MLSLVRKNATSWLIKLTLFAIVIVFIFWGGYSYQSRKASRLAKVGDHYISVNEYRDAYDNLVETYRKQLGDRFSQDMIRRFKLKDQALNMLIERYLVMKAAHKLGLEATVSEVQEQIIKYPVFQVDGHFNQERYVQVLRFNHMSPEQFEKQLFQDLTVKKVQQFIRDQAIVTDQEIKAQLDFNYARRQLAYIWFNAADYLKSVKVTDADIKAYYDKNKDRYMEPEKRHFAYVTFFADDFLKQVSVNEDDVKSYYNEHKKEFEKEKQIHARHILFRLAKDAPKEQVEKVRKEAEKVLALARQGKDFAKLAKQYSQGPSAKNGGDLGFFTRKQMVPAFADAAFALKPGQISDLVRTSFGFHIIKVEQIREAKTTSFEDAKKEIELKLKREKARDIAYEKAQEFNDAAVAEGDLVKAAKQQKVKIRTPDRWFSQLDQLPGIGANLTLMQKLFKLEDKEISSIIKTPRGFVIAEVTGIKPATISPLEKVKKQVESDCKDEKAMAAARKAASEFLAAAKKAGDIKKAGAEKKLKIQVSGWFARKLPDKHLTLWGPVQDKVFQLTKQHPFPDQPLQMNKQLLVCQLLGTKAPPKKVVEQERERIRGRIRIQKQVELWNAWITAQREHTEIKVLQKL